MKKVSEEDFIRETVGTVELLAVVAEEAVELSHAALKLRRVLDDRKINPTPVIDKKGAIDNLLEEYVDLVLALSILDPFDSDQLKSMPHMLGKKQHRWVNRLKEQQQKAGGAV